MGLNTAIRMACNGLPVDLVIAQKKRAFVTALSPKGCTTGGCNRKDHLFLKWSVRSYSKVNRPHWREK